MKKKILIALSIVMGVVLLGVVVLWGTLYFSLRGISQSHIEGNTPPEDVFGTYLTRDLHTYFARIYGDEISVTYELLRDEPTQVGVGAPKYYLWVDVDSATSTDRLTAGAVVVGANAQESFTVVTYLSKQEMSADESRIVKNFPSPLVPEIKQRSQ